MKAGGYTLLAISLTIFPRPLRTEPQEAQQAREWRCLRQPLVETTDGNVLAMHCVAALPKSDKLDTEDEGILAKLEIIRYNAQTLVLGKGDGKEAMNAVRMGFGQKVGQICEKHPNIVLAALFTDSTSVTTTLYGCKNIAAAPERQ